VRFTFSGSQSSVERFILALESVPYLSVLTAVTVTSRTEGDFEARVAMKVFIISYAE
jgi:hypothetical protein